MTYIDLIKRFWSIHDKEVFSPNEIAIYFYLLKECNRQRWPSPFVIANKNICLGIGISESTLIRCRARLVSGGVFAFKSEKDKRKPPTYYLHDYFHSESRDESSYSHDYFHCASRDESSYNNNKDIKTKDNNNPPYPPKAVQGEFNFGKPKRGAPKPRGEPPEFPTLDEVKKHFIARGAPERIQAWEREAEIFYNHFMSIDWVDARGRKIKRWDSRANLWIAEKEKKQNEQSTAAPLGNSGSEERIARFRAKVLADIARGEQPEAEVPF